MDNFLDFEGSIAELEGKTKELRHLADSGEVNIAEEVARLEARTDQFLHQTYNKLTAWQKTQVARHPERPHTSDYVAALLSEFTPLSGDRTFGEDKSVIGGLARFRGRAVMVIGHEKGSGTEGRVEHNFGMAHPEGYRKAVRLLELADRFGLPVVTFIDTPGAYPGIGAEERGQAEAIARSIEACVNLRVALVSVIIGEGGSGGAMALAAGDRVLMLEHAVYSVISPEGCASILWRSSERARDAAEALKLTAQDLIQLKVIDEVMPEPVGGAHRHPEETIATIGDAIARHLGALTAQNPADRRAERRQKYLDMGRVGL